MTYHLLEVEHFMSKSLNKHLEIHTSKAYRDEWHLLAHHFWESIKGEGSSLGDAIQICLRMGFDNIILAGCPMTGGDGYFHSERAKENVEGCPRFGNKGNEALANRHFNKLKEITKEIDCSKVKSISGNTAELFGKPKK